MLGGYCKGNLVRKKINQLMEINMYDYNKIELNKAQIYCMIDLEIIDRQQAMVILNHYNYLEQQYKKSLEVISDESYKTSKKSL